MATQRFDELNNMRSLPYEQYFGEMQLTDAQKKRRIRLAEFLEDWIIIAFEVFKKQTETDSKNLMVIKQTLVEGFMQGAEDIVKVSDTSQDGWDDYIAKTASEIVDATERHSKVAESPKDSTKSQKTDSETSDSQESETDYWTSEDRAKNIAENESNTMWNNEEYLQAIKDGYTHKVWNVFPDNRVRPTHIAVYGAEIPIDSYFDVGNARMLYPKDVFSEFSTAASYPEEVCGCRCSLRYIKK